MLDAVTAINLGDKVCTKNWDLFSGVGLEWNNQQISKTWYPTKPKTSQQNL